MNVYVGVYILPVPCDSNLKTFSLLTEFSMG